MNIVIIEADPIFIEFEIIIFQGNIVKICEGLFEIDVRVITFKIRDDRVLGVVRVEIGVRVNVFH
jgi:hypothetical protein